MCGLVGVAGDIFVNEKRAFKTLLILDSLRGIHSTGVATAMKYTDNIHLYKETGDAYSLFRKNIAFNKDGDGIYDGAAKLLMGHNRWATTGAIIPDNAHPFHIGDIVGAHNGTLNAWNLDKLEDHKVYDVDSAVIFHNINKLGVEETMKRVDGAWALTWYDNKTKELNLLRNKERPLFYCWSENNKTMFWASEEWMLRIALGRAGIKHHETQELEIHKRHILDLSGKADDLDKKDLMVEDGEYKGFIRPPVVHHIGGRGGNMGTGKTYTGTTSNVFAMTKAEKKEALKANHVDPMAYAEARKLVGKEVEFYFGTRAVSDAGQSYMNAFPYDIEGTYNMRLYLDVHHKRIKEFSDSVGYYTGKIKKLIVEPQKKTMHFVLDHRSISKELNTGFWKTVQNAIAPRNTGETVEGFNKIKMTVEQYGDATCEGCVYCSASVKWDDAKTLKWISASEFLCEGCSNDPQIVYFAEELTNNNVAKEN